MSIEQEVRLYARPDGVVPFKRWIGSIRDRKVADRILRRIARLALGNFGDSRSVGEGVQELRIPIGPGIRVYFGRQGEAIVVLLCGGDKQTQRRDIGRAQLYWKDFRSRADV